MRTKYLVLLLMATWAATAVAGVTVTAPKYGANVSSPVQYVASATTGCTKGVAAMGIYTAPGQLAYKVSGHSLNTELKLNPGTYNTVVQEWDNCGGSSSTPIKITVGSGGGWVNISAPSNNSNVAQQVQYVANAGTGNPGTFMKLAVPVTAPSELT